MPFILHQYLKRLNMCILIIGVMGYSLLCHIDNRMGAVFVSKGWLLLARVLRGRRRVRRERRLRAARRALG
jgi:hypothetical protein